MKNADPARLLLAMLYFSPLIPVELAALPEETLPEPESGIREIVTGAQEMAREWANALRDIRSSRSGPTPYMGVVIESVPSVLRDYIDLPKGVGILVASVYKDSPAEKAGLLKNDVLFKFDDQLIMNFSQFSTLIDLKGPGATVPVHIFRKGEQMVLEVTLEERIRRGTQWLPMPPVPESPEPPSPPEPEEMGIWLEKVDEWIPGSVRVFIDDEEQVHVDIDDLKDDLAGLQEKIRQIHQADQHSPGIVMQHGDMGARTTVIHSRDRQVNYSGPDGRAMLTTSADGDEVSVWNTAGELLYQGDPEPANASAIPDVAVPFIQAILNARKAMLLDPDQDAIDVQLTIEAADPVTLLAD